jgi:hypothetical protein
MEGLDPHLAEAVRDGSYVVDPDAVAERIIRRERRRLTAVLEALQFDAPPVVAEEGEPGTFPDAA